MGNYTLGDAALSVPVKILVNSFKCPQDELQNVGRKEVRNKRNHTLVSSFSISLSSFSKIEIAFQSSVPLAFPPVLTPR